MKTKEQELIEELEEEGKWCSYDKIKLLEAELKGFQQGKAEAKKDFEKMIDEVIKKFDSNWFYCDCKNKYGNEVRFLLEEFVKDLEELKQKEDLK